MALKLRDFTLQNPNIDKLVNLLNAKINQVANLKT